MTETEILMDQPPPAGNHLDVQFNIKETFASITTDRELEEIIPSEETSLVEGNVFWLNLRDALPVSQLPKREEIIQQLDRIFQSPKFTVTQHRNNQIGYYTIYTEKIYNVTKLPELNFA